MPFTYPGPHGPVADEGPTEIELSIVMPCLNEALTVGRCVDKALSALRDLDVSGEIIVADNGSSDESREIARAHGARLVHVRGRGYGNALQAGIAAARGRYVIMGDADDSYDFSQLGGFVDRLREGYDLVMGNRFRGGILPGAMPALHRYFGNPLMTALVNLMFRSPIHDVQCGLRGFSMDAYRRMGLTAPGMEFASEMVAKACLHRQNMTEIPIILHPDGRDRPPHLRSFRDGWRNLRYLLVLCPRWLYLFPAALLLLVGLTLATPLVPRHQTAAGVATQLHALLLGGLSLLLGFQALWFWAFATIYRDIRGASPTPRPFPAWARSLHLEHGLIVGSLLFLAGLGLSSWLFHHSGGRNPGPFDHGATLRTALNGCMMMALGVQTIFGSFLLSMLDLVRAVDDRGQTPRQAATAARRLEFKIKA